MADEQASSTQEKSYGSQPQRRDRTSRMPVDVGSALLLSNKSGRQQLVNMRPLRSDVPFVVLFEEDSQDFDRGIQTQSMRSIPSLHARDSNRRLVKLSVRPKEHMLPWAGKKLTPYCADRSKCRRSFSCVVSPSWWTVTRRKLTLACKYAAAGQGPSYLSGPCAQIPVAANSASVEHR